jgi:hypothetical protein
MGISKRDLYNIVTHQPEEWDQNKTRILRNEIIKLFNEFFKNVKAANQYSMFDLFGKVIESAYTTAMSFKDDEYSPVLLADYLVLFDFVHDREEYLKHLNKGMIILQVLK